MNRSCDRISHRRLAKYFTATRSGVFFFDRLVRDSRFKNILKIALSTELNPVARYLAERHTPVHEEMVASPKAWKIICPRADHWHVMAGPIVNRGRLVGAIGCTREKSMPSFSTENLADLSAICLHLSVWSATTKFAQYSDSVALLTPRELEIAELVAKGKTQCRNRSRALDYNQFCQTGSQTNVSQT